ncbi:schlafen family member 12-like, partial [Sigmodon hispidus]
VECASTYLPKIKLLGKSIGECLDNMTFFTWDAWQDLGKRISSGDNQKARYIDYREQNGDGALHIRLIHTLILRAVCALMNSRRGKVKAHIENQDYDFTKHGIWEDLETSLKAIIPLVHNYLDFYLKGRNIYISVKKGPPWKIITIKTSLLDGEPEEDVKHKVHVKKRVVAFFDKTTLTDMAEFDFSESKNVEYKSFKTDKLIQRVKEVLPRTVSAFANTDGGYLFIGLDGKTIK